MAQRKRLTNNSDETEIASLISGDTIFSIPYFQRAYKWKAERLDQLNQDILSIVDGASDFHFLGAVIVHGRRRNPSDPDVFDVIDGQQRITTLFLYLAATVRILLDEEELIEAAGLFQKYLVIGRETDLLSNMKLHPCKEDRNQLNAVIDDLLKSKGLRDKLGTFKPKLLPPSGKDKGTLRNNYKSTLRFLKSQREQGGIDRVRAIYQSLLESMSVVQIDVWDPTNGPKIFDSLNSRQEPMTIGDLVRNEIFSRVAGENPDEIEQVDQHYWQPFYKKFQRNGKNLFDSYFFPYGLTQDPNLRKSEVYGYLRDSWRHTNDPQTIIAELGKYQDAFIDITCGSNSQEHSKSIHLQFHNLWLAGAPSSTYPFLMRLSQSIQEEKVTEGDALSSLSIIESFLVRRAICGHEPTGLHAVFKRLWMDCVGAPNGDLVEQEIRKHKTVVWPSNDAVEKAVLSRPLYGASITHYLLMEYNKSLGGDQPANIPWIEHILPETPAKEWFESFTKEKHHEIKDTLSNLIPLSQEMNQSLCNRPYPEKSAKYQADSMFKSARQLAAEYQDWTPDSVAKRAAILAAWVVSRWCN
jgi:uncharacterized protein with ParB-like and HNH nuclease domain